jgi:MFS family permease
LGLLGALLSAIGASLPSIQESFGIGVGQTGQVSAYFQLCYACFCFLGGFLTDFLGKNRVLMAGGLLYGACTILLGAPAGFQANLAIFTLAGIGAGLLFIGSNTMIVQLFPEHRGKYLNLLHLCFAIGSVIASLGVSAFISLKLQWNTVFRLLGYLALVTGLFFAFTDAGAPSSRLDSSTLKGLLGKYKRMLSDRLFLSITAANVLAIGTQFGIIYLLVSFLKNTREVPHAQASLMLALFFVLLGAGRLVCSYLITRFPISRILTLLLSALFVLLLAGWLTRGPLSVAFFVLTGLACSGLMPGFMALASLTLPREISGLALGILAMFGGLGGMALTRVVTWLAGSTGFEGAFLAVILVSAAALVYFVAMKRRFGAAEKSA